MDEFKCVNYIDDRCVNCVYYTRDLCLVDYPNTKQCKPVSPDDTCDRHEPYKSE